MHTLKIDRSFVQSIDTGPERAAFVRAIVELADALSLASSPRASRSRSPRRRPASPRLSAGPGLPLRLPLEPADLEQALRAEAGSVSSSRAPWSESSTAPGVTERVPRPHVGLMEP